MKRRRGADHAGADDDGVVGFGHCLSELPIRNGGPTIGPVVGNGKVQKEIIRDFLTGSAGREKAEGWLPNYMAFPFKA